jgi:hypothetical protein
MKKLVEMEADPNIKSAKFTPNEYVELSSLLYAYVRTALIPLFSQSRASQFYT